MKEQHTIGIAIEPNVTQSQCRTAFMCSIVIQHILDLTEKNLPKSMNRNILRQTVDQLSRAIREIRHSTPDYQK